jgi:hypothetical protein
VVVVDGKCEVRQKRGRGLAAVPLLFVEVGFGGARAAKRLETGQVHPPNRPVLLPLKQDFSTASRDLAGIHRQEPVFQCICLLSRRAKTTRFESKKITNQPLLPNRLSIPPRREFPLSLSLPGLMIPSRY